MSEPIINKQWVRATDAGGGVLALAGVLAVTALFCIAYLGNLALGVAVGCAALAGCAYYVYALSYVAINRQAVALRRPLRADRAIAWPEIRYVLTDRTTYAFIGSEKSLMVQLGADPAASDVLRTFINDLTRARGVPVMQTRGKPSVKPNRP